MSHGAYGVAGAIHDMIQAHTGNDYKALVEQIEAFLIPSLGADKK